MDINVIHQTCLRRELVQCRFYIDNIVIKYGTQCGVFQCYEMVNTCFKSVRVEHYLKLLNKLNGFLIKCVFGKDNVVNDFDETFIFECQI